MTFQIAKSVIDGLPYNYTESVEAFRQAKLAHRCTGDSHRPRPPSSSRPCAEFRWKTRPTTSWPTTRERAGGIPRLRHVRHRMLNSLGWGHVRNSTNYAINVGSRSSSRNLHLNTNLIQWAGTSKPTACTASHFLCTHGGAVPLLLEKEER
jgi:hypothetical protein